MGVPDVVVVGAGFAGSVVAERLASAGKNVLVLEKKDHVGGHCHDQTDRLGILTQTYGPHIFHTNNEGVWQYLCRFSEWLPYEHKVLTWIDGKRVPLPFNFNTIKQLFPERAAEYKDILLKHFPAGAKVPILQLRERAAATGEEVLRELADYIYEKAFLNYTRKQWGCEPEELVGVLERVPVLLSHDDRYFHDKYQALPAKGFTKLFERLLDHPRIEIRLNTDYKKVLNINLEDGSVTLFDAPWQGIIVYTGPLDEFFNQRYGPLPYRSLIFKREERSEEHVQAVPVENHPNHPAYTRITEYKLFYRPKTKGTALYYEFPAAYDGTNDPYYPIPKSENHQLRERYVAEQQRLQEKNKRTRFYFVGRLAEYKYYNMDGVVARALALAQEIEEL